MKLTKKLETEILKVYNTYWDAVLKGDIPSKAAFMDDNIQIIGSAEDEVFLNKKDAVKFYNATSGQVADKVELRNRKIVTTPVDNLIFISETCDMYVLIEKKWAFYSKFRLTSLLQKIKKDWKFVHVHASIPDSKTEEGEQLALKKIQKENLELREAVKRHTTELEHKNRELEIEAALEHVRSLALGMRKSGEVGNVTDKLFEELNKLSLKLIGCTIVVIDAENDVMELWRARSDVVVKPFEHSSYTASMNVLKKNMPKWFPKYYKGINEKKGFISDELSKGKRNRFLSSIAEEYNYSTKEKQRLLDIMPGKFFANFVFFKLGYLALITEKRLPDENLAIARRFVEVFEFAYTRFLDIKNAEEQAREAEIQLALERVRARTMAMQHSDEIDSVGSVLFHQLQQLNIPALRRCLIGIVDEANETLQSWFTSMKGDSTHKIITYPISGHPVIEAKIKSWRERKPFSIELKGKKIKNFVQYTMSHGFELPKGEAAATYMIQNHAPFKYGYLEVATHEPISDDDFELVQRFAKVFEQTYTRFLDLQKAEAQARESEIQLALERVRARTMAMQKSDELLDAASLLFHQVKELGCEAFSCGFVLLDKNKSDGEFFMSAESKFQPSIFIPNNDESAERNMYLHWVKGANLYIEDAEGKELVKHFEYLMSLPGKTGETFRAMKKAGIQFPPWQRWHAAYFSRGYLLFITKESFEETGLFPRFASVFEQTYTRFLDLQKAEEQTKEAQIQTSLERVRASAMAMHKSEELLDVCEMMFKEFLSLGFDEIRNAIINIHNDADNSFINYDYAEAAGKSVNRFTNDVLPFVSKMMKISHSSNDAFSETHISGKTLTKFRDLRKQTGQKDEPRLNKAKSLYFYFYSIGIGAIGISTYGPINNEKKALLKRFRDVFNLSYKRYIDISKAEAQAREAEIQLALERVRARTMAMHKSAELSETSFVLFQQFVELGIVPNRFFIGIINENESMFDVWITKWGGKISSLNVQVNIEEPLQWNKAYKAWKANDKSLIVNIYGEDLIKWNKYLKGLGLDLYGSDESRKSVTRIINTFAFFSKGFIAITTPEATTTESVQLLERFASVFDGTYRRFLDLQKAERQAREAQIEAALERVRSRTMGMQHSSELQDASDLLFKQILDLGVPAFSCGYNIWEKGEKECTAWMSDPSGGGINPAFKIPLTEDPNFIRFRESKQKKEEFYVLEMRGERMQEHYQYLRKTIPVFDEAFKKVEAAGLTLPETQIHHLVNFDHGNVMFITLEPCPEAHDIFKRFGKVFEQTYTRFLDLQKAETQAREARIEAALERVRSRSIAMRKSEEIADIAGKIFSELRQLDLALNRVLIWTFNDIEKYTTWWSANPEVESTADSYRIDYNENPVFLNYLHAWQQRKPIHLFTLSGDTKKTWEDHLFEHTEMSRLPMAVRKGMRAEGILYTISVISEYGLMMSGSFEPLPEASIDIIQRFGRVFQQSYTRYLDVQKAETQAREAQIEAALERVRSRTMGMQKSEELKEVIQLVYEQFIHLNIHIEHTGFILDYKERDDLHIWLADQREIPSEITIPCFDSPPNNSISDAKEKGQDFFKYLLTFEEKNKFYRELFKFIPGVPEESLKYYFNCPGLAGSGVLLENIGLYIENFSGTPYTDEENIILMRFGRVFQQTYTRFLDLKKAEEQAREAQIEAALERVRARSMGMHKSNELKDVVRLLYKEFRILVTDIHSVNIQLNLDSSKDIHFWASVEEDIYPELYHLPYSDLPIFEKLYNAFNSPGEGFLDYLLNKEEKDAFFSEVFKIQPVPLKRKKMIQNAEGMVMVGWFHKHSGIDIVHYNLKHFSEEEKEIVKRFAAAFEQTYIRFLDLQKAEAQAKEAEIQLALERVRARTMAMHKSNELAETAAILFQQMTELGVAPERLNICLIKEEEKILEVWATDQQGVKISHHFNVSLNEPTTGKRVYDAWKEKKKSIVIDLSGKELNDWLRYVREVMGMTIKAELVREHRIHSVAFFSQGMILTTTPEPLPKEPIKLLERFADVFNLTYRRFLDLQKAEIQAREAQIESALERVRSRTMGMQRSDELQDAAVLLFQQVVALGVPAFGSGFNIWDDDRKSATAWMAGQDRMQPPFKTSSSEDIFLRIYDAAQRGDSLFVEEQGGEALKLHYDYMNSIPVFKKIADKMAAVGQTFPTFQIMHCAFFSHGYLMFISFEPVPDAYDIFKRFANVFEQTYTRFLDLQKAEAQAREAVKQASLDRVRGKIASMRTAEDLNRITPIIWNELKTLEVPFIRCGVFIIDEEQAMTRVYLTTPDGKSLGVLNLSFDANDLTSNSVEYWRKKEIYREYWDKQKFISWTKSMMELGQVQNAETYQGASAPPESLHLHFVPFAQGMLYVGDVSPLTDDKLDLVKTLAEAFSIAYARYEDFKNLEDAKNKIELTFNELKSAQAQLIHAEKLASLGELTAGIAHEIKNPLNFVNNFSELSKELLDEIKTELENNNKEEILAILEDMKLNLEKINEHGKRADSIVKGMLLHSRGSSGEKTLTDINDLLDQYVNLAYHGMRAQNKEFNITIEKDYDETLEKINVVPQDISRVFLNIINNACYAAYDKKKKSSDNNYSPTLKVSSKKLYDRIEIRIGDNGNGIPKEILDKIFQPFFTTKPTGEGTGLGLSLSYDIVVKQHGGDIKIDSKEGEGAEFVITLPNS